MLFPIIKVYDKATKKSHIVGTNSHDLLLINDNEGTISYSNIQNGEGTGPYSDYEFKGKQDEAFTTTVEFVSFEELKRIYDKQMYHKQVSEQFSKQIIEELFKNS